MEGGLYAQGRYIGMQYEQRGRGEEGEECIISKEDW